jgi:hypothetical protein
MSEKKRNLRLPIEDTVFVEVMASGIGEDEAGTVVRCRSLDISGDGLKIAIDREIRVGAILQIGADLPNSEETLFLAAQAKWCRPSGDGELHWVGFELLPASNSDIADWKARIRQLQAPADRDPGENQE